jgi:membrane-bound serine protease (ClpP class)
MLKKGVILALSSLIVFLALVSKSHGARVYLLKVDSAITPATANFIIFAISKAQKEGAQALVIELDTPGGLVESTREIVKAMLDSEVPIIVYVSPSGARAASAGAFIVLASHLAGMAPGTHVGAAHPIELSGKADPKVMEKIANDLAAYAKNLAELRGRDQRFAEEMVKKSVSLTEKEALRRGVVEILAEDLQKLLHEANGRKVKIKNREVELRLKSSELIRIEEDLKTRIFKVLTNPNLIYFLLMLGLLGLYLEFSHPGAILPGVVGAICLILALFGLSILPVNYAGLALILLAGLLFFLETQVPSHGLLAIGGAVSLLLGSLLLFGDNPPWLKVYQPLLYTVVITFSLLFGGIAYLVVKTQRKKPVSGEFSLIGKTGKVIEEVSPKGGRVSVSGEIWSATADEIIPVGEEVLIEGKEGFRLKVKKRNLS